MNATRISTLLVAVCLAAQTQFAAALEWKDYLQSVELFEGDAYGTTVDDIFLEAADPNTNKNGQGIKVNFGSHAATKHGYLRFDNLFSQVPAGAFIYKATLELTTNGPSTGSGMLMVGARGAAPAMNEATATFNNVNFTNRHSNHNQLYADAFGTTLTGGETISINITPSVRAWYDNTVNPAHGYANNGLGININPIGSGSVGGDLSFFDSEHASALLRPRLKLEYLPAPSEDQPYVAKLYQRNANDTAHIMATTGEDTLIRTRFTNAGINNLQDNNFGGQSGAYNMYFNDGTAMLLRMTDLEAPAGTDGLVDAEFRLSGTSGWSNVSHVLTNFELRALLKDWVEGEGGSSAFYPANISGSAVAGATYESFNRSDVDPDVNLWQTAGALGATDSVVLSGNAINGFQTNETFVGSAALRAIVEGWLNGDPNNGLMLRALSNSNRQIIAFNTNTDPYTGAGMLLVYNLYIEPAPIPEPATALCLVGGLGLVVSRRRRSLRQSAASRA